MEPQKFRPLTQTPSTEIYFIEMCKCHADGMKSFSASAPAAK